MSVGCECADRLTQSNIASKKDSILKKEYTHLQTFIKSPKWKEITKGKFTFYIYSNLDGFKIMIRKKYKTCYNITIIYFFYKNDEKKERKKNAKQENICYSHRCQNTYIPFNKVEGNDFVSKTKGTPPS